MLFTGINYFGLSTMFFVFGILILWRLRIYFRDFYDENFKILALATLGLSTALVARGILDVMRYK